MLGPSGSGKSTLTLCLDGLIPHLIDGDYSGEVVVAGLVVGDSPVHLLAQETGLVFQDPDAQFCTLTVEDEIAFGLENLRRPPEEIEAGIDRALSWVGLEGYRHRRLATLSGGEKQRIALAAVLAMGPRVLVLDEPSANLDPRATSELFRLLRALAEERRHSLVIIEHKLDELIDWVDSVLVLAPGGRMLFRGDPAEAFYEHAAGLSEAGVWRPQTAELVAALRETGWSVPGSPLSIEDTVAALAATPDLTDRLRLSGGRRGSGQRQSSRLEGRGIHLETKGLSFRYPDGHVALTDISVSLERGRFLAIAGENGAGKSTLASLLTGVLEPPSGTVFLDGRDVTGAPAWALSDQVGYVFQNPEHQFVSDTVLGELAFSLSPKAGRKGVTHLTIGQRQLVDDWLGRLGLLHLAEASPFSLSQGQKRRLSVAAMLIRGQSALILDEPTLGQDELQAARLMAMMQEFRAEGGTVAMVSHDMRLVSEYAESLLVLSEGRAVYLGSPEGFFSQPGLVEASGLAVPALGRVCAGLHALAGTPEGLHTLEAFLQLAGSAGARTPAAATPVAAAPAPARPAGGSAGAPTVDRNV